MYLRTVPRVSPVRRAIADTLKPCSCSSRITISSLNRTTPDLPRTVRGKVITCRALHRDPAPNGQPPPSHRVEVVKIQPPDLERIHPAMTRSGSHAAYVDWLGLIAAIPHTVNLSKTPQAQGASGAHL